MVDLTVSAMYPDVKLDDKFMDAVILATLRPELKGLQPEGFVDGTEFRPERFHLRAVLEVCETAKRYFRKLDVFDCEADLEHVLPLVRELHSCPESVTCGENSFWLCGWRASRISGSSSRGFRSPSSSPWTGMKSRIRQTTWMHLTVMRIFSVLRPGG